MPQRLIPVAMSNSQSQLSISSTIQILSTILHAAGRPLVCLSIIWAGGCESGKENAAKNSTRAAEVHPTMLAICGDTSGWIVPCGCSLNQSGGLARRHSFVADLKKNNSVVVLDVGGACKRHSNVRSLEV